MKIFVLLSRVPYPLDKGDKLRAFNQLKSLSQKHQIFLCALNDKPLHPKAVEVLRTFCKQVEIIELSKIDIVFNLFKNLFSSKPLQTGYFYNYFTQYKIDKFIKKFQPAHIFCQLIRTSEYVRKYNQTPKTLDYMDALSKGMERRIEKSAWYLKPILKLESKRLAKYETEIFDFFDNKIIISEQDKNFINHPKRTEIAVVSNGVDVEYFNHQSSIINRPPSYDLLFTGNMNYPPNIFSVEYLVKEILPLVFKKIPSLKLLISGTNPSKKVLALKSKTVTITGFVEDIRTSYSNSKIFIAPMLIGTGLQNKLLEAMAMKLPCITSGLANNALGAAPNENILIGNSAEEYAKHILFLLENENERKKLAENGNLFVNKNYSWEKSAQLLETIINQGK